MLDIITATNGCRVCVCGCTDDDCYRCWEKMGEICFWVEEDLCSACTPCVEKREQEIAEALAEAYQDGYQAGVRAVLILPKGMEWLCL